jgi:S1-C subfamily serine protease
LMPDRCSMTNLRLSASDGVVNGLRSSDAPSMRICRKHISFRRGAPRVRPVTRPGKRGLRQAVSGFLGVAFATACVFDGAMAWAGSDGASANLSETIQREVNAVFEKTRSAVVRVEAADDQGLLAGTGFFIEPDGLLYTLYSVGGQSHDIVVCRGDLKYPATRVGADPRSGIAILKVDARTSFLPLGESHGLAIATPVMAVGYPMDLPLTPSFGFVGGFDRKYLGRYFATTHIRANVAVQRGQGGAPLLNMKGEVVGVLISSLDQGSALFALPIEAAEKVRRDIVRFGGVHPGWMGIDVGPAAEATAGSKAEVRDVFPNAAGYAAGIRHGDVLLKVGRTDITTAEDVLDASFFLTADDEVQVRVARGQEQLEFNVLPQLPSGFHAALPVLGSTDDLGGMPETFKPLK